MSWSYTWRLLDLIYKLEGLPASQKSVLAYIAFRMNHETGYAFPSVRTIARACALSKQGVRDALGSLEGHGLIQVVIRGGGARDQTNCYRIDDLMLAELGRTGGQVIGPEGGQVTGPGSHVSGPQGGQVTGPMVVNLLDRRGQVS